ncbi:hypothetical protein [Cytobacillus firmus]|uniref:hypothetical protein n=1 Tax=Cytobacillus firmus TaxID=1399 RepID=UPI001CFC81CF|nr:hypothetical protein [Cytobacillus firmus]
MKLLNKLEGLFTKVDITEASYQKALEQKEEQLLELQLQLKDKETSFRDLHKMEMLGQVSKETYEAEKEKFEQLKAKVAEAQREVQLIEEYKTEDVHSILTELEADAGKYSAEKHKEIDAIKDDLLQAKLAYIERMVEARDKYNKIVSPARKLDALKIKLGIKQNSYVSDALSSLSLYSVPNGGYENLLIDKGVVYDALSYGEVPSQLERLVKAGK